MTDDFYKQAFEAALDELETLKQNRRALGKEMESLDERMDKVRQAALGLLSLAGIDFEGVKVKHPGLFEDQLDPRVGITEAARQALAASDDMLTAHELIQHVFKISPAVAGHKNPFASLHAVIRRLMDKGDVISKIFPDGKTEYGWIGSEDAEERVKRWFKNGEKVWEEIRLKKVKE